MLKTIFSLAVQGNWRRKRQSLLVTMILAVSFAFMLIMISSSGSIAETNKEYRYSVYGSWYGSILKGEENDVEFLSDKEWLDSLGTSVNYATAFTSGGDTFGIGTVDENLAQMGIVLIDGRLPENSGEIAIEGSILSSLGIDYSIGQKVTITIPFSLGDDTVYVSKSFTLCGIISEYTKLWSASKYITLNSAIVIEEDAKDILSDAYSLGVNTSSTTSYFFTIKEGFEETVENDVNSYLRESRADSKPSSERTIFTNTSAYTKNAVDTDYNTTYVIMIFVISIIAVFIVYVLQMQPEIQKCVRLRSLGATKGQLALLVLFETLLICIPSLIFGTVLGILGTWLLLRLAVFGGSVAVSISIPWVVLLLAAFIWILSIIVVRMITYQVALSTPLTGRMKMRVGKRKFYSVFQKVLIFLMSISLCISVTYSIFNSLAPLNTYQYWDKMYDYAFNKSYSSNYGEGIYSEVIADEEIEKILSVPGIENALGYAQMTVNIIVDGEMLSADLLTIDATADWSDVFNFSSVDIEAFENGEGVLLAFASTEYNPDLESGDTLSIWASAKTMDSYVDTEVMETLIVKPTVYDYIGTSEFQFAIVCSRSFMQRIVNELPDGMYWTGGTSLFGYNNGSTAGFNRLVAFANNTIADSATDKTLTTVANDLNLSITLNNREVNTVYSQDNFQTVILLFVSGICIALVVLIILSSTIRLETQREKRRYGILQAIGMSKRQRNLELMRTALLRSVVAVVLGWGVFFLTVIFRNLESIKEEGATVSGVVSSYMSNITNYYMPVWAMAIMTVILFAVVFLVCYLSKLSLNRYTLMELLHGE